MATPEPDGERRVVVSGEEPAALASAYALLERLARPRLMSGLSEGLSNAAA